MIIGKDTPMWQAVLENNKLLPLLSRFQIRLGFGESTVEEVCGQHGIDTGFFLEIARAYLETEDSPVEEFAYSSLETMVRYLQATHDYYLNSALPRVEELLERLLRDPGLSEKENRLLTGFFEDYKKEFLAHIDQEEQEVLPYILELEKQSLREKPDPAFLEKLRGYSISQFAGEHDRLEFSLENLSKLIIKYLPPFEDQQLCVEVLHALDELVVDLVDHADMEDKVLVPRVADLEKKLLRSSGQQ